MILSGILATFFGLETEDFSAKKKDKHQNRAFYWGNKSIMGKSHAEINSFQYPPTVS